MDETRNEKYLRQTAAQFEALGRFVQEFELLVDAVRTTCTFLLSCNNSPKHQQLVNVAMFHQSLTALPLFEIMRGLYAVHAREFPEHVKADNLDVINRVMKYCATEFKNLAHARNDLLHGTWFIGWASEEQEDFSELQVSKFRVNKNGYKAAQGLPRNAAELLQLANRSAELSKLINRIVVAYLQPAGSRVATNIRFEDGRWLPEPPRNKDYKADI